MPDSLLPATLLLVPAAHFTQLVWKDTRSMGCGIGYSTYNWNGLQAACKVVACRYLPPGNIMNERLYITNGEREIGFSVYVLPLVTGAGTGSCFVLHRGTSSLGF